LANDKSKSLTNKSSSGDIQTFLEQVNRLPAKTDAGQGRLLFAIDATASRQPTWDNACHIQASMFQATEKIGGLSAQLCYYRGFHEFHYSSWLTNATQLQHELLRVECLGGHTQIARLLQHVLEQSRLQKINAVIFIGDAIEESADNLCSLAGQLGLLGIPLFIFHEGINSTVQNIFQQMTKLSGGAYCPFNQNSAHALGALLGAVAVYATGGRKALNHYQQQYPQAVKLLTQQLDKSSHG